MRKLNAVLIGICTSLLIIAPPIPYSIPVIVNSYAWCYMIVAGGLFGLLVTQLSFPRTLKILSVYLFVISFFSQAPALAFNAYILSTLCFFFYLWMQHADLKIFLKFIAAAFWLEFVLAILQYFGKDTMLSFGTAMQFDSAGNLVKIFMEERDSVFMGTVMQYMRFASVLAIMTPLLVLISRWYIVPVTILCLLSQSSSFALSLLAGAGVYGLLRIHSRWNRIFVVLGVAAIAGAYIAYDWGSFRGAVIPSNGGRLVSWFVILKTWCMDTVGSVDVTPTGLSGPLNWHWVLFGHGADTFLPLFPVYKHDMNPFPQAHNDWLQFLWEIGAVGLGVLITYTARLASRLLKIGEVGLLAGFACIGVNMFFTFPTRMTQTALLIVLYISICECVCRKKEKHRQKDVDLVSFDSV